MTFTPRAQAAFVIGSTLLLVFLMYTGVIRAAKLTFVSDTLSTSATSTPSRHTIQFTTASSVPASGKIVITQELGAFTLPASLDYTDFDLAVGGTDRALAATANATDDGVSADSGTGVITITLNSSSGIGQGQVVSVEIGDHATFGDIGDQLPINPSVAGSFRIRIETMDAAGTLIDTAKTMIATIAQVAMTTSRTNVPPTRSNGLPSGLIAANNPTIEITLNTDEPATCRYATTTGVVYASMTGVFEALTVLLHAFVFTPHANQTSYNYYVRCIDDTGMFNTDDYTISFQLDATPPSNTSLVVTNIVGTGGSGEFSNGSRVLFLSNVTVSGFFAPGSTVTVMRDGVVSGKVPVLPNGRFAHTVQNLERGSYTITVYGTDKAGRNSSTFSTTLTLAQGTNNTISNIVIAPTLALENESVGIGDTVIAFGEAIPGSTIEMFVQPQSGNAESVKFTATSTVAGAWSIPFDSDQFKKGTYVIRVRSLMGVAASNYSPAAFLGIGEQASPDFRNRADINRDGKVNLVDFSIMLTFWGTDDGDADINLDSIVNLADFSVMLFYWTG